MLRTGFEVIRQVDLNTRVSTLVPENLAVCCRHHVRSDDEAGRPWWTWGGGSVAADLGRVVGYDDVEVIVAT